MNPLFAGRFRRIDRLGVGGMGEVWWAVDERDGQQVALKVLTDQAARSMKIRARFASEAAILRQIDHPNVIRIVDHGVEADGAAWIAMALCDAGSADDWVARHGPMSARDAVLVVGAMLDGLGAAHGAGVVHRDVKPANLLLNSDGTVVLTDFGIAQGPDDARADVFAAGATLYALLTGRDPADLTAAEATQDLGVPEALVEVIRRATRFHRDDRYATAGAMAADLRVAGASVPDPLFGPPLFERLLGEVPEIPVGTFDAPVEVPGAAPSFPEGWEPPASSARPPPRRPSPAAPSAVPVPPMPAGPPLWGRDEATAPPPALSTPPPPPKPEPARSRALPILAFIAVGLVSAAVTAVALAIATQGEEAPTTATATPPPGVEVLPDGAADEEPPADPAADSAPRAKGRLLVLSPTPAAVRIAGQDVGDAPVEVEITVGHHNVDLRGDTPVGKVRLKVKVDDSATTTACWSFERGSWCDDAELNAAKMRW